MAVPAQRNPRDSMKSTYRTDKSQWWIHHWLLELLGVHPTNLGQKIPVHKKEDPVPNIPHWVGHSWVLIHATWPLLVQQLYINYYGVNFTPWGAFLFYNIAYTANAIHELNIIRKLGHIVGFLDGDKHERDQVPDHSVIKVVHSLLGTAIARPLMTMILAYRQSEGPSTLSWWVPVEIGLYQVILDGWFYLYHRLMHEQDFLWKFHRTHHLTKHPNALLTLYADEVQEMFDIAGIPFLAWGTLKLMGFPMGFYDWWYCHQYIVFTELFGHSGLRVHATPASTNTPIMQWLGVELVIEDHDLHHRQGWKKSHNYGKVTLFWDKLFGTMGKRQECYEGNIDYENPVYMPWW